MEGQGSSSAILGVATSMIVLPTIAVTLRFVSRKLSGAGLWYDDWLALAALPFTIAINACFYPAVQHGFGTHNTDGEFFLHELYFGEPLYNTSIALSKLSVLCFYYRVLATKQQLRLILWTLAIFTMTWWITMSIVAFCQCIPPEASWNPEVKGACINQYNFFIGQAVPNIFTDFVLLLLPLPILLKLQIRLPQKIGVVFVFLLGYFVPIVSILRLVAFLQLSPNFVMDINFQFIRVSIWTLLESGMVIISASIPALSYLFKRALSASFLSTHKRLSDDKQAAGSEGRFARLQHRGANANRLYGSAASATQAPHTTSSEHGLPLEQIHIKSDVDIIYHVDIEGATNDRPRYGEAY